MAQPWGRYVKPEINILKLEANMFPITKKILDPGKAELQSAKDAASQQEWFKP